MTDNPFREIPPPKRPKTNYLFIVVPLAVFGTVTLLGLFAAGLFFVLQRNGAFAPPRPRPPAESLAEKQRANAEAFSKEAVPSDASPDEIDALLLLLERVGRITTPEQVEACFDVERLYREAEAVASKQEIFRTPGALKGFRKGFTERVAGRSLLGNWVSTEVKRVRFLGSRDEAIVYSQHRNADGTGVKMRWWVTRSRGKWKIYDFEDLDMGIRSSANVAAVMDTAGKEGFAPRQSDAIDAVRDATNLLAQSQYDQAEQLLRRTLDVPLPKALAAWRLAQLAIVQTSRGNWEEVIDLVGRAAAINPEMPTLSMLRTQALNGLGRFEEAAAEARKYIAELGGDDHGSFLLGTALAGMGRNDEAADAFRQGLDAYSSSVDNLVGLAGVLPDEAVGEIADRFAAFQRPTASFVDVASQLTANDNVAALAAVVEKNCELAPRDPHNDYYQGELHWHRAEYNQAAEAFGRALAKLPEDERLSCQKAKRNSLLYAKKPVEAYHAMPDGDDTFLAICNYLVKNRDADGLDQMAALHAERKPDDSWIPYFRGEALMLRERYDEAAAVFRPMLHAELPEGMRSSYQDEYLAAEIKAGRPLEAYQAVPDATDAFLDAANRLLDERNADDLEKLVALHAERKPDDPYATYFRGEVFYLRGETAEAVIVWEPLLASELPEGLRQPCFKEYLRCMAVLDKPIEGYRAIPDAAFAFEFTADLLLDRWNGADALEELIAAHAQRLPDDPWLAYYRGRLFIVRSHYEEAAELLAPLIGTTQDERLKIELADACRAALTFGGKPQEAYAISLDHETGFERTAAYLADKLDAENLAALIATREAEQADDPALPYYRARLAAMGGNYQAAADSLAPAVAASTEGEHRNRMVHVLLDSLYQIHNTTAAYDAVRPAEAFSFLASRLADDGNAAALDGLVTAYQSQAPDDPELLYYRGRVAQLRGRDDEAAAAFTAWFKTVADEDDEDSLETYLEAMADARRPSEAYPLAPDAPEAFHSLAGELAWHGDADSLDALIDLHTKDHADDPWLGYWRGRTLLMRGQEDGAVAAYQTVLHAAASHDTPGLAPSTWREFLLLGKPLEAYAISSDAVAAFQYLGESLHDNGDFQRLKQLVAAHEPDQIAPRLATLNALVDLCRAKRDAAQFAQLLDAHRERFNNDARLPGWQLEVAGWKGDDEAVLRGLDAPSAQLTHDEEWRALGLRVRALVRLKRFDDARAVLDSRQRFQPAPLYRAVIEAAAGNVPSATMALYDCLRSGTALDYLYKDPQLGAALRSDAFADFRERHPEAASIREPL